MEALRRPALAEDAVRYRLLAAAGPGGEALLRLNWPWCASARSWPRTCGSGSRSACATCRAAVRARRTWVALRCSGITWRMSGSLCTCCGRSPGSSRGWQPEAADFLPKRLNPENSENRLQECPFAVLSSKCTWHRATLGEVSAATGEG
ncbi:uncharacterized protein LOC115485561 isoform X2 [Serinus canaria]|uniref:uncharacterized protein LOC115485561 isoform X2 n=1 Tax=Serinus canaria TaxID=9135 RepID=UPI0021CD0579|nr:uncharacterized protein LOC115485561 isoform X2 [Serinus canaria]